MIEAIGAACFGTVLGWFTYFTLRYKKEHAISDLSAVIAALGGAGVLKLFATGSEVFAFYEMGLAVGFFGYVIILLIIGARSKKGVLEHLVDGSKPANPFMG